MSMLNYSELKQNYKGLWVIEVTDERGFTKEIKTFVRKADATKWVKAQK